MSEKAIDQPGVYDISPEAYLADPVIEPSLSASIAKILLAESPQHAWFAHPRLNPAFLRDEEERYDIGTAAHRYILEGKSGFAVLDFPDWRTKASKEARDAARAEGKLPLLAHRWADVQAMAGAAERQLAAFEDAPRPFTDGRAEETLVWKEGTVWLRTRLDWFHADHRLIDDLKTSAMSVNPDVWGRNLFNSGFDIQAALYRRGVKALFGIEAAFRFVCIENTAPYALSVIALDPAALAIADRKVTRAISIWGACLESGQWPGFPTRTCYIEMPAWVENEWLSRELVDAG